VLPALGSEPSAHAKQVVAPCVLLTCPQGQSEHDALPDTPANRPGEQARQVVELVTLAKVPVGHEVHEVAVELEAFAKWPREQPMQDSA
jgi:hypothetical protein